MEALKAALWFAKQGYGVFPVWGVTDQGTCLCPDGVNCTNGAGKHPATKHGFKDHTSDPGAITKFLNNPGTPNYGLVPPPRVGVIDVDKDDVLRWDELQAALGELPPTLTTVTANGFHYHFDWGDDPVPANLHGLIVRGTESGYVVGPGSHHKSGIVYDLLHETTNLSALPEKWKHDTKKPTNGGVVSLTVGGIQPESVGEGHRHAYLRDRARTMRGAGMADADIFEQLGKLNARFPAPKSDEEIRRAMGDVGQFAPDPLPITLTVPTTQELSSQQRLDAQRAAIQTLDQLPFGKPPEPLVLGTFVAPEGVTVLYANGGTGKGLLALWMMRIALFEMPEKRICVLDYEGHRWEWGNRARAIGWSNAELERVLYIDPYDPVWKAGHTLAGIAPELRPIGVDLNVGLYVVDSYAMAASAESELGGVKAAKEFFQGGASLGAPGLVLAHTSADKEERFPAKPFGSVFIHNLARETWAGAQVGAEQLTLPPGVLGITGSSIEVELRNKKRSVGGKTTASQLFDIEFRANGDIRIEYKQNYQRPLADLIIDVLATGSMTARQMAAAIKEDTGREVDETTVRRTIARGVDGLVEDATKRPKVYSLEAS